MLSNKYNIFPLKEKVRSATILPAPLFRLKAVAVFIKTKKTELKFRPFIFIFFLDV
jgi:hypothetical protein